MTFLANNLKKKKSAPDSQLEKKNTQNFILNFVLINGCMFFPQYFTDVSMLILLPTEAQKSHKTTVQFTKNPLGGKLI